MESNHAILQSIQTLYYEAGFRVFYCDQTFRILWRNRKLSQLDPQFAAGENLSQLVSSEKLELIKQELKQNNSAILNALGPEEPAFQAAVISSEPDTWYLFLELPENHRTVSDTGKESSCSPKQLERSLAAVSGQLRSPLFRIFNLLEPVEHVLEEHEEYESVARIRQIEKNCYKLMRAVLNLTEYNKLVTKEPLRLKRVQMNYTMQDLCHSVQILLRNTGVVFDYQITQEPIFSMIDEDCLMIALMNVISNSCLYSRPGSNLHISLTKQSRSFLITVADTGLGIPAENLPHIFDPYFSYDYNGNPYAGVGIGLTIAKLAAEAHGGQIYLSSSDEGTIVTLRFPIRDEPGSTGHLRSNSAAYITNRFSPLYVFLSALPDQDV